MAENQEELQKIFRMASDLQDDERARYLDRVCAGDAELKRDVETLLTEHETGALSKDQLSEEESGNNGDSDPLIGQRLGAYKIEREIGRGGMGAVYVAERADDVFQRRVAIKIIKRGMDTDFVLRRFRHERRILAALDHPNIARLLDGGATASGLPYFVMEYIEGDPIYLYCDAKRLDIRDRLRLFCQVCDAVDYAHQKQIIHRDIKPNNILVTSGGIPKLFDFGIAKILNPELSSDTSPMTATAMRMMTVDYASPEQVEGLPVTHLSDVYSLGVLLFELLTGHRPYHFRNRLAYDMARVICEEIPPEPSVAVSQSDNLLHTKPEEKPLTLRDVCDARSNTIAGLKHELSGSLDVIALKALRKAPSERYQSVQALRQDIERFLQGRPIAPSRTATVGRVQSPTVRVTSTEKKGQASEKSIAVLPFKILGARTTAETDEYLGVGLADALITRLSNVRRLTVRPTSSVLQYGETGDPFQAGQQLAVDYIVDGNIRRAGETLRVTVQLLNVAEGATRWAGKFDERFTDVLRLEDLISEQVAGALIPHLTREEQQQLAKRGTHDPKAYAAYLRGRYFWNRFTPDSLPRAIESFETAKALDPRYALAYVGIADFYNWAGIYGILPSSECYRQARSAAVRALELDESLGEAYAALALLVEASEWDWEEAERLYLRALELTPNYPLAHEWYSSMLVGTGRVEEGLKEVRRAEELDPLSARAMTLTAWTSYQARQFEESLVKAEQIIDLDQTYPQGFLQRGITLVQLGRAEEGVAALRQGLALMPNSALPMYELTFALVAANHMQEARAIVRETKDLAVKQYVSPYFLAMAHASVGELDTAFEWFEKAFDQHDAWIVWFGTDPKLDPLRSDPRFIELFRRTNNPLANA